MPATMATEQELPPMMVPSPPARRSTPSCLPSWPRESARSRSLNPTGPTPAASPPSSAHQHSLKLGSQCCSDFSHSSNMMEMNQLQGRRVRN